MGGAMIKTVRPSPVSCPRLLCLSVILIIPFVHLRPNSSSNR